MTILQAANNGGERRENDFYPTPVECVQAIIPQLVGWPRTVWEPSCGDGGIARTFEYSGFKVIGTDLIYRGYGDGGIAKIFENSGFRVVGTDLIYRGYGEGGIDFLKTPWRRADAIVTNPPFGSHVSAFIKHALDLETPHIAMLINVNLWHAANRTKLWQRRLPEAVYALCWKPDFTGAGRPYFNCVWTVWGPKAAAFTKYERLAKPKQLFPWNVP